MPTSASAGATRGRSSSGIRANFDGNPLRWAFHRGNAACRSALAALARLQAELAIDRQGDMRFCRAGKPSYCVKALENTQSILCRLFLVWEHFRSGRTATYRTALDFRGIFVLLDAGGLTPAKEKRAKSSEKTGCPTHGSLPIDGRFSPTHMSPEKMIKTLFAPAGANSARLI